MDNLHQRFLEWARQHVPDPPPEFFDAWDQALMLDLPMADYGAKMGREEREPPHQEAAEMGDKK